MLQKAVRLHRLVYDPTLSLAVADALTALAQAERSLHNEAEASQLLNEVRTIRAAQRKQAATSIKG